MTTETILTPEQVDALLEGVLRASGSRLGNYTYQKTLDELRSSIRAIEQAVLQSPEIQALRKDAERYRWIRDTLHSAKAGGGIDVNSELQVYESPEPGEEVRVYWYPDTPVGFYQIGRSTLDEAVNAAMEQQK